MTPESAINLAWLGWYASWCVAAWWVNRTRKTAGLRELPYAILEIAGLLSILAYEALIHPLHNIAGFRIYTIVVPEFWSTRLWQLPETVGWGFFWFAIAGFLFCWWARLYLGRLWSGFITRKDGHQIVETGPYAIVRHPIYTGVLSAALAAAAIRATPLAVASFVLLFVAYQIKGRLEERFLSEELGADAYSAYRRRVPMLVPFGPRHA